MYKIPSPITAFGDQNRFICCQMAIEARVQTVIDEAVKAGWNEAETLAAIIEIADNLMLAAQANAELTTFLTWARRPE